MKTNDIVTVSPIGTSDKAQGKVLGAYDNAITVEVTDPPEWLRVVERKGGLFNAGTTLLTFWWNNRLRTWCDYQSTGQYDVTPVKSQHETT